MVQSVAHFRKFKDIRKSTAAVSASGSCTWRPWRRSKGYRGMCPYRRCSRNSASRQHDRCSRTARGGRTYGGRPDPPDDWRVLYKLCCGIPVAYPQEFFIAAPRQRPVRQPCQRCREDQHRFHTDGRPTAPGRWARTAAAISELPTSTAWPREARASPALTPALRSARRAA